MHGFHWPDAVRWLRRLRVLLAVVFTGVGILTAVESTRHGISTTSTVSTALFWAASVAGLWWPLWALPAFLAAAVLASGAALGPVMAIMAIGTVALANGNRLASIGWGVLALGYAVLVWLRRPSEGFRASFTYYVVGLPVAIAISLGLVIRYFLDARDASTDRLAELAAERDRIYAEERAALARELHDVVAHQLSVISLQTMAHGDSDDPDELRELLRGNAAAAAAGRRELQLLVGVLGGEAAPTAEDTGDAVDHLVATLRDQGFSPAVSLPDTPLDPRIQRTVDRVLTEGVTNILRYAEPGTACDLSVHQDGEQLRVRVASAMAQGRRRGAHLSSGFGLRGIRERAGLLGGSVEAGQQARQWVLTAELPLVADEP